MKQRDRARLDLAKFETISESSLSNLWDVLAGFALIDGDYRAARDYLREARGCTDRTFDSEIRVLMLSAWLESRFGNDAAALDLADEVYARTRRSNPVIALGLRCQIAVLCRDPAECERAQRYLESTRDNVRKLYGADHWRMADCARVFAGFYVRTGDPRGIEEAERVYELLRGKLPADAPQWKYLELGSAYVHLSCGEPEKGEALFESALVKFREAKELDRSFLSSILRITARIQANRGNRAKALRRYDEAVSMSADIRHTAYHHGLLCRERDAFLTGKIMPLTASDPLQSVDEEPTGSERRSPTWSVGR